MLPGIEQQAARHGRSGGSTTPEVAQARGRRRPHQPRIVNSLDCVIFHHAPLRSCPLGHGGQFFSNAHFRAARAGIVSDFLLRWAESPFSVRILKRFSAPGAETRASPAVFQRVIAEDDPASSRRNSGRGPRKKLLEFLLFSIHRSPQRQKRFCRGMQFLPSPCLSGPCHNRCQVFGVPNGTRANNCPGDSA